MTTYSKGDRVRVDGAAFGRVVSDDEGLVYVRMEEDNNLHPFSRHRLTLVDLWGRPIDGGGAEWRS
jgi:hypothetical protein